MRPKRLGRGLGTLLNRTAPVDEPGPAPNRIPAAEADPDPEPAGGILQLPVDRIRSNPFQPRSAFPEEALEELCASIRTHGILQPVVVRSAGGGAYYELVAGERRWRAARKIGLESVPAVLRPATDEEMQTLALVENLQREDLNAMEKARALRAMMRNFGLTQEDVATRVGKARTTVANILRLLDLPPEIHVLVEEGRLSGAHARALLQVQGTQRRLDLARLAVENDWSVREIERRARLGPTVGKRRTPSVDPYLKDLQDRLRAVLSTEVRIQSRGKGGRIEIRYHDADELDRLLEVLKA